MRMTLFVDASFCGRTGAGGWGAWAKRDDWARGQFSGGPIRLADYRLQSSTTAEIAGIALALWQLKAGNALDGLQSIMIQCDNVTALAYIRQHVPGCRVSYASRAQEAKAAGILSNHRKDSPVVAKIMVTVAEMLEGIKTEIRHVKGHSYDPKNPQASGRQWVNHRCDQEAYNHMLALRKEIDDLARYGYSRPQLP